MTSFLKSSLRQLRPRGGKGPFFPPFPLVNDSWGFISQGWKLQPSTKLLSGVGYMLVASWVSNKGGFHLTTRAGGCAWSVRKWKCSLPLCRRPSRLPKGWLFCHRLLWPKPCQTCHLTTCSWRWQCEQGTPLQDQEWRKATVKENMQMAVSCFQQWDLRSFQALLAVPAMAEDD